MNEKLHPWEQIELTPTARWNYALCVDERTLAQTAQIQWNGLDGRPFDLTKPFVCLRLPACIVDGWEIARSKSVVQFTHRVVGGKWQHGPRVIKGEFAFTPPLPAKRTLKTRLSDGVEWIELVPYGSTLLRITVFPQAPVE